jgi:hypothetical protein
MANTSLQNQLGLGLAVKQNTAPAPIAVFPVTTSAPTRLQQIRSVNKASQDIGALATGL